MCLLFTFLSCFPASPTVFFHSAAGRQYPKGWLTSSDGEREEDRDWSGAWVESSEGHAHSVLWAWRVIPKRLQAEMGRRAWPGFYSTESPVASASFLLCVAYFKKCTTWEFQFKFYLGPNEDYSPGEHISDSSEKLLQRGRRKVSVYVTLVKREFTQSNTYFCRRFLLVKRSRGHHEGLYCFSGCEEMQELGL